MRTTCLMRKTQSDERKCDSCCYAFPNAAIHHSHHHHRGCFRMDKEWYMVEWKLVWVTALSSLPIACRLQGCLSLSDAVYAVKQSKASLSQICFWSKQRSRVPTRDRVGEAGESSWLCLAPSSGSVFLVRERVGGAGESPLPVRLCLAPSSGSPVCIGAQ